MKARKLFALIAALLLSSCAGAPAKSAETAAVSDGEASPDTSGSSDIAGSSETESAPVYASRAEMLPCSFFDEKSFDIYENRAGDYPADSPILCGTVPHHLTAGHMISGFFKAAAKSRSDIENIVIIATSHYEGGDTFYTTFSDWDTPFGAAKANDDICAYFCDELGAVVDDERLASDHSAASQIPFAKYHFDNAKISCLLVAPTLMKDTAERLANALYSLPDRDKCLFVFSIDFSHYLSPPEADMNDEITRRAVDERDYAAIERFGNNNVDSPTILSAFTRLSDLLGADITEADNSNTQKVNMTPYSEEEYPEGVTTYFVFITQKQP